MEENRLANGMCVLCVRICMYAVCVRVVKTCMFRGEYVLLVLLFLKCIFLNFFQR